MVVMVRRFVGYLSMVNNFLSVQNSFSFLDSIKANVKRPLARSCF